MASRRADWIDRQVAWIHEELLEGQTATILDLGCGPGFYSHRLTMLGHRCHGIDFSPASIDYARENNPEPSRCEFALDDIRHASLDGPYDLAMVLFGELNVFSPAEALGILQNVRAHLAPRGKLILETQTPEAVENTGRVEPSQQQHESGLFSDRAYLCRTENRWLPEDKVAVQKFFITELDGGPTREFRNTTKAWTDEEFIGLLTEAGFNQPARRTDWPCNTDALQLWQADCG